MSSKRNKVIPEIVIIPSNPEWEAQELADSYPIDFIQDKVTGDLAVQIRERLGVTNNADVIIKEYLHGDGTNIYCDGHKVHFSEQFAQYSSILEWIKGDMKPALHTRGHNK